MTARDDKRGVEHRWSGPYHDRLEYLLDGRVLTMEEVKGYLAQAVSAASHVEFGKAPVDAKTAAAWDNALASESAPSTTPRRGETPHTEALRYLCRTCIPSSSEAMETALNECAELELEVLSRRKEAIAMTGLLAKARAERDSALSATLWKPWDGTYEKQFYDVRYDRCKVQLHCWPNAGKMIAVDGSGLKWGREDAVEVRVSEFQMLPPALCDVAPNNSPDGGKETGET